MDNFAQYAEFVASVARELTQKQRAAFPDLADWAVAFKRLYDNFNREYERDPMLVYRPKHRVAWEFHSSPAFVRYFRAGNRTSKTQSGYAEHYYNTTAQNKWRPYTPGHTAIIGLQYNTYAPQIFEQKMISGETGNPLSPMFPVGGKWLYHYDDRKHTITVACPECAENGKAGSCKHNKRTIKLFSDEIGWEQLQGAVYSIVHFDEHVDEGWYDEGRMRTATVPNASIIITGTPLFGIGSWENRRVADVATGDPALNRQDPEDPSSPPLASLHEVSMFDAGIVPHDVVRREMASLDEFAIKARIYGQPAPATRNPVFDRFVLAEMYKQCRKPEYISLGCAGEKPLEDVSDGADLVPTTLPDPFTGRVKQWTGLRVWQRPEATGQYIAAVDSARGLAGGDASCCSILRVENRGMKMHLTLVAQYHGWINAFDYADEVFKAAVWYNSALVVVELTGGFGDPVVLRLKRNLAYWNIYRPQAMHASAEVNMDARLGVDTNASRKPFMVAALQQFVRDRDITLFDKDTTDEMANFAQEDFSKDGKERLLVPRFRGAGGSHDDRVMSLVIGTSTAVSTPLFDFQADARQEQIKNHLPSDVRDSIGQELH